MTKPFAPAPRAVIPTPNACTEEVFNKTVAILSSHYSTVLTPTTMITARKGCYATVINSTIDDVPLEQFMGSVNAQVATEIVLNAVKRSYSAITTHPVTKSSKSKA
jgi:hypothetical protein